jgi:hypothetical protein
MSKPETTLRETCWHECYGWTVVADGDPGKSGRPYAVRDPRGNDRNWFELLDEAIAYCRSRATRDAQGDEIEMDRDRSRRLFDLELYCREWEANH